MEKVMDKRTSRRRDVDGGWAWMVMVSVFVLNALVSGLASAAGVYTAIFVDAFAVSKSMIAWAGSLQSSISYFIGPLAGYLTNKYGCRPIVMIGGIILSSGLIITYFAPNIFFIFVSYGVITGIGFGISYIPAVTAVTMNFEKYRGIALGFSAAGSGVGTIAYPILITYLHHLYNWRSSLLLVGAIGLHVVVCGAIIRPLLSRKRSSERPIIFDTAILKSSSFILVALTNMLFCFGTVIIFLFLVSFAKASGWSESKSSMLISCIGFANILGRIVLGAISTHPRVDVTLLYCVCFLLAGTLSCLYPVTATSYAGLVILSVFFGLLSAAQGALLPLVLVVAFGVQKFANCFGLLEIFLAVGFLLGGPFAGFLYDVTKSYNWSMVAGGLVLFLGGGIMLVQHCCQRSTRTADGSDDIIVEGIEPLTSPS